MNIRGWAFLACRMLALYALYLAILNFASMTGYIVQQLMSGQLKHLDYALLSFVLLNLSVVLILWFGAPWFSRKLIPEKHFKSLTYNDEAIGAVTFSQLIFAAIIFLGLYLVCTSTPQLFMRFSFFLSESQPYRTAYLLDDGLKIIFGLLLIIGSARISQFIRFLRNW